MNEGSLRQRVRCSSLVDWPVYPRLRRTMRASTRSRKWAHAARRTSKNSNSAAIRCGTTGRLRLGGAGTRRFFPIQALWLPEPGYIGQGGNIAERLPFCRGSAHDEGAGHIDGRNVVIDDHRG
jgi:hypothetical protein